VIREYFPRLTGERVNILILGKSGANHAGAELTDTLILASISLTKPAISLVSIPRDIWVAEIRAKINSAYFWGQEKPELGGGFVLAKSLVAKITGQPIDYALIIDFSGFKEIVDAVGGIKMEVANSFTDRQYPIAGKENDNCNGDKEFKCRYETVHFDQGLVRMNGETALKFVRSRNGDNNENTDIAREARQQKVISAIKTKVLSFGSLLNVFRDRRIYLALKNSVTTDFDLKQGSALIPRLILARNNVKSFVSPEGVLVNPPALPKYDLQYVFVPKGGDWKAVADWIKNVLP